MSNFTYNAQYVTLKELVDKLQPMAQKFGIKVYSKGKALVEDFGTFNRIYYKGNWGNGLGKLVEEKLFNKEA